MAVVVRSSPIPRSPREAAIIRRSQASSSHSPSFSPFSSSILRLLRLFHFLLSSGISIRFPTGSRKRAIKSRPRIATIVPRVSSDRGFAQPRRSTILPRFSEPSSLPPSHHQTSYHDFPHFLQFRFPRTKLPSRDAETSFRDDQVTFLTSYDEFPCLHRSKEKDSLVPRRQVGTTIRCRAISANSVSVVAI